jgi:hypothetical protein
MYAINSKGIYVPISHGIPISNVICLPISHGIHLSMLPKPYGIPFGATESKPFKDCVFKCGFCPSGQNHICRICKAENHHRTDDCPNKKCDKCNSSKHKTLYCNGKHNKCLLECGSCSRGEDHSCRCCGALNHHRTKDCPNR